MRQCEFKRKYDPEMDMHMRKHLYGEGVGDIFRSIGTKLFGKTAKSIAKKAATTAATKAATKTGEFVGNKAGDKIVALLSKGRRTRVPSIQGEFERKPMPIMRSDQETNDMVNRILSGGRLRKRNLI